MPNPRPPKLRQRNNGSLYVYFYDSERAPTRKNVYMGVVIEEDLESPVEDAPASVVGRFYQEYHDPYMRGRTTRGRLLRAVSESNCPKR